MTVVELVRHTQAGARTQWTGGPDAARPLTDVGQQEAERLAQALLAEGDIDGLYSSPFSRCRQTLEPLEAKLDLPIIDVAELAEAEHVPVVDAGSLWVGSAWIAGRVLPALERVLADHPDGRVVLCSHGDVIPSVLALLAGRDELDLSEVHLAKGARASLHFQGPRCVDATLVPPV